MWTLYLLWNHKLQQTYLGITTNLSRRVRQHTGQIKGGAKATKRERSHWALISIVEGFKNRSEAMRWEKLVKLRCRGLTTRDMALQRLEQGICPEGKKPYKVPSGLRYILKGPPFDWGKEFVRK